MKHNGLKLNTEEYDSDDSEELDRRHTIKPRYKTTKKLEKKKRNRQNKKINKHNLINNNNPTENGKTNDLIEVEYVDDSNEIISNAINLNNDQLEEFVNVLNKFSVPRKDQSAAVKLEDEDDDEDLDGEAIVKEKHKDEKPINKKKANKKRFRIADLKLLTNRPETVESWDVTAPDPKLLVQIKSLNNTIPVPKNWTSKSSFLSNKRGITENRYKLPDYIESTGISKLRDPDLIDSRIMRIKAKDKVNPKIGKMEIKYELLYEAFFVHQVKPKLSRLGEVYYDGKEFEERLKRFQPGRLSDKLRAALGMTDNSVPPFILNMHRYGPPPAYPKIKIPGINCQDNTQATPNLWKAPIEDTTKIYVFNSKLNPTKYPNWGDLIDKEEEVDLSEAGDELSLNDDIQIKESMHIRPNNKLSIGQGYTPELKSILAANQLGLDELGTTSFNTNKSYLDLDDTDDFKLQNIYGPNSNVNSKTVSEQRSLYKVIETVKSNVNTGELFGTNVKYNFKQDEKEYFKQPYNYSSVETNDKPTTNSTKKEEESKGAKEKDEDRIKKSKDKEAALLKNIKIKL